MAEGPVANVRDLPAFAGVLLALTALAMPWSRRRACPIFEECGPWESISGWEAFGVPALVALSLSLVAFVAIRPPVACRLLPAVLCGILGVTVAVHESISF